MSDLTRIIALAEQGDGASAAELLPLVYDELRRLAALRLATEKPGQTMSATSLVHEAYLRLVGGTQRPDVTHHGPEGHEPADASPDGTRPVAGINWRSRAHFFAAAAEAMRRIVIDRARAKATQKRGGAARRLSVDELMLPVDERSEELLRLDEALTLLETHDEQAARLVKLRFFAGMPHGEAAATMGISRQSADRLWKLAKTWLYKQVAE